jgi:MFS transporter, MHS family, proline/betaine transporter
MKRLLKIDKLTQDFIKNSFGNIIEWYDFTIYGLFAIQISNAFFPTDSKFISLLLVFLTFAVGFVARPVGSLIFGMIGDRKGKHYAVNLSIWFMAIPTALMGLLPTYHTVGILAPIALVVLRILQGISAGGQFSGLITIAVDSEAKNKTFLVSLIYTISVIGCFLASFVGYLTIKAITGIGSEDPMMKSLTWRIPFILSGLLFIIYIKLRPDFTKHSLDIDNKFSFMDILRKQPRELVSMMILSAGLGSLYYILFTYLVTYMQLHLYMRKSTAFMIINIILLLSIMLYPIFGYIAYKYECRLKQSQKYIKYLLVSIGLFACAHFNVWLGLIGLLFMVIYYCAITSFSTSLFAELFAANYRMTACSFSFNVGMTIAGFSPLMAEIFSKLSIYGLPVLMAFICIVMYLALNAVIKSNGYKAIPMHHHTR